jgi:hypothetical protein
VHCQGDLLAIQKMSFDDNTQSVIDYKDKSGSTALLYAARAGKASIVNCLIKKKASVNIGNSTGKTPLYFSSMNGHVIIVKKLLANKATVDIAGPDGATACMLAAENGYTSVVSVLLCNGALVDKCNSTGMTALMYAAVGDHTNVAELLLTRKATVGLRDNEGATALFIACSNGHSQMVNILLNATSPSNTSDLQRSLIEASRNGDETTVAILLSKAKRRFNIDIELKRAMSAAIYMKRWPIVTLLTLHDSTQCDIQGNGYVRVAVETGKWQRKKVLEWIRMRKDCVKLGLPIKLPNVICNLVYDYADVELLETLATLKTEWRSNGCAHAWMDSSE